MGKEKNSPFFFITFFFIQTFLLLFLIFSNPNFHDRGKKTVGLLLLEAKIFSGILISSLDSHHGAISGKERRVFPFFPISTLLLLRGYFISEI
jgi:hypothetical protein